MIKILKQLIENQVRNLTKKQIEWLIERGVEIERNHESKYFIKANSIDHAKKLILINHDGSKKERNYNISPFYSEKLNAIPVNHDSVLVKAVDININNNQYKSTFSDVLSFCVKSYSNICKSNHDAIICVENRMCFDQFNPSVFEQKFTNPLIVFRGSPEFPINASMNLMKNMNIPTYSYCDIDPSGILIALSLPNFKDAITPIGWREKLENLGSFDLFLKQGRVKVDTSKHTNLNTMSKEINRLKKGLVQEAFILSSLINY